ncbi:Eco57I restriction-modification methylase domain-containing protein [Halomarina ordinaria]|uniref:site-specific DNA-methyltransferase (adenine-specific) n=1 Tax=Halomarina ordinaria TaxID=3033939 RepID=A0ABD5UHS3_9EURY|nr:TaqI-like C-terminal specificity domain-containing protein [Halomarina sp. PSRA2]
MSVTELREGVDTDSLEDLVDNYNSTSDTKRRQKREAAVRQQFINPLLRALGWDTESEEVRPEHQTDVGPADYAMVLNGRDQFYVEAKKFSEDLDGYRLKDGEKRSYVDQAVDYAYHQRCEWAVLTNFEEIRLYWTYESRDATEDGLVLEITVDEFLTEGGLEKLSKLSKRGVSRGSLGTLERSRKRKPITEAVQQALSSARGNLTSEIHSNEPELTLETLREGVQRILDRLVVMRVAEDRSVISEDTLYKMKEAWDSTKINPEQRRLIRDFSNAFQDFDSVYNSELFARHECETWAVPNETLKDIIDELYEYNFEYLDADILGSIYEDYLGHAIREKEEGLELEEIDDVRREGGIYYTPVPVVEYIVDSTLGERLNRVMDDVRSELNCEDPDFKAAANRFSEVEQIRFLDVSCGSGSFLIKAYDKFEACYKEYQNLVRAARPEEAKLDDYSRIKNFSDYRQRILRNNLFGVDLDYQATEIASVNLFLKALKSGEKLPTILEENIKRGNSLLNGPNEAVASTLEISVEEADEMGAFDWETEFEEIVGANGDGFSVIAGNPPWGADVDDYRDWVEGEGQYSLASGQYDTYELFIELTAELLGDGGTLGFIIPDSIFREEHEELRKWLAMNYTVDQIHKLGEGVFEDVWTGSAIIQYTKTPSMGDNVVECSVLRKEDRDRMQGAGGTALSTLITERQNTKVQQRILDEPDYAFKPFADEDDYAIMDIMGTDTVDTAEVLFDSRGDEIGKSGEVMRCPSCMNWDTYPQKRAASKGGGYYSKTCTHCEKEYEFEEAYETREIIKNHCPDSSWKRLYFGEHVTRYRESGHAFIDDSIDGIDFEDENLYSPPKILLRKTGFGFNAFIDYTDARCLQVVYVFRLLEDRDPEFEQYDLEYFLGLLNSRVMLYYYTKERSEIEWQSYPYKTQGLVMGLPYPEVDFDDEEEKERYDRFVNLVRNACKSNGKIDRGDDWEIEKLAYDFYGIPEDKRTRIRNELNELQRLQVVRELFPDAE